MHVAMATDADITDLMQLLNAADCCHKRLQQTRSWFLGMHSQDAAESCRGAPLLAAACVQQGTGAPLQQAQQPEDVAALSPRPDLCAAPVPR